jgi:16S rRNA (guanine1207-N2)-methyltransferase
MNGDAARTLFHPFETEALPLPAAGARFLFLGAHPEYRAPEGFAATLACVQGFRPTFLQLAKRGLAVTPRAEGEGHDGALVLCDRHRGRNELWVAEAIERTRPGGLLVIAGGKQEGIDSLRKRVGALLPIEGHLSKHHGVAFWFRRAAEAEAAAAQLRAANPPVLIENRFRTAPGMFSHDRVDAGSRLLAEHLPEGITGAVADFGAGWGYLSAMLVEACPAIASLDLYEADFESLEAAKVNLGNARAGFFWHDLLSEPTSHRYNCIVMNPPFHQGRAADPGIGEKMIRAAAAALVKGGRLVMVANRQLPYEPVLNAAFADMREICRDGGFKVLTARR